MTPERWQRIEQLYHDSLERTPQERAAWLAVACGDDTVRREVEVLLAAKEQIGNFLNTPAIELEAKEIAATQITLSSGEQLSHYQVLSKLGAGGMGEVYLAHDTSLERKVALKVLPAQFTTDAGRLHRFTREAKAASALNHPNIITIYEIGHANTAVGDTHFIAIEFIDGITLRQRLNDGRLGLGEALEIARQIAAALDTAHRAGIIHRDIKPENIMLRPDGLVKVLDFGLAKLTEAATPMERTPWQSSISTVQGLLMGTPRYMSPEQARGQKVDARSDIFSFGQVLYEMITGQPPFTGQTIADVFAALLDQEPPPLTHYLPSAPAELDRIVRRALAKDCQERYQTVHALQLDLQALNLSASMLDASEEAQTVLLPPTTASPTIGATTNPTISLSGRLAASLTKPALTISPLMILAGLVVISSLGWFLWTRTRPLSVPRELQFTQVFGKRGQDQARLRLSRFSPNGKYIAFAAVGEERNGSNIWVRQLSSEQETQLTFGAWQERSPVWSPDGERLAFISNRGDQLGIWVKPLLGDAPTLLRKLDENEVAAARRDFYLIAWAKNEAVIYYWLDDKVFRLDLETKATTPLPTPFVQTPRSFVLSPNEQEFAFVAQQNGQYDVWRVGLHGEALQRVTNDPAIEQYPRWQTDSMLLYNLTRDGQRQVYRVEVGGGAPAVIPTSDHQCQLADYSSATKRLLCYEQREESDIYATPLAANAEQQITNDLGAEFWASTAPNGRTLLYQAIGGERFAWNPVKSALFTKPVSGGPLTKLAAEGFEAQWAPNGEQIGFLRLAGADTHLWAIKAVGGEEKELVTSRLLFGAYRDSPPYNHTQPQSWSWSPDSRRIAYCAVQNGVRNIWTVAVDSTQATQISTNNDGALRLECPLWSPDGQRLAWMAETGEIGKQTWSLWVSGVAQPAMIFQTPAMLRFLGWTANDRLLVALAENIFGNRTQPTTVKLLELTLMEASQREPGELTETYLSNLHLAPNGRQLAFVKAPNGRNDIWSASLSNGNLSPPKKITNNTDPTFVFASLTWSPDGQTIFFDKQTRWSLLTLVDGFN